MGWLQPQASLSFWGGGLWDLGVGNTIVRADNQSLAGTAMRLADQGYFPVAVQAVLTLAALGLGLWGASRVADHVLRGPIQMCIMSIAALLASPVSWTHHWIWVVPVAAVLVALRSWLLLSCGAVVLWIGLIWLGVPAEGELGLEWGQQLLASSYVVLGLAAMGVMANAGRARQPRPGVNAARS
jgi:alpha-1,2-mannosyltransferase